MYRIIVVFIFSLIAVCRSAAQERVAIHSSGTYFVQPVKDKKWANSNGEDFTAASYKFYSGLTYITLTAAKDTEIELAYDLVVKEGGLEMEVTGGEGEAIFSKAFTNSEKGSVKLKITEGTICKVNFRGKATSGSYKAQWKQL